MTDRLNLGHHISRQYNAELEAVRRKVLEMGGLVEMQLSIAVAAMVAGDPDQAERVAELDHDVDALEVAIDEDCTRILARRQPAASDLRLIMAVIKVIAELERIGDESERVARMTGQLEGDRFNEAIMHEVEHMGAMVAEMLRDVLNAFARTDPYESVALIRRDDKIDAKYESLTRLLVTHMAEDPRSIPVILNILWAARAMERIGDRCQNVAEHVIYLVHGKDVRHSTLAELEASTGRAAPEGPAP